MFFRDRSNLAIGAVNVGEQRSALVPLPENRATLAHFGSDAMPVEDLARLLVRMHKRKTLLTGMLAIAVMSAPASARDGLNDDFCRASVVINFSEARALFAHAEEVHLVRFLKRGLRGATVLFGRLTPSAHRRNLPTMTTGIRN